MTRQVPFSQLSSFIPLLSVIVSLFFFKEKVCNRDLKLLSIYLLYVALLAIYSLFLGNSPFLILRFSILIFLINLPLLVSKLTKSNYYVYFRYVYLIQVLVVISFEIALAFFLSNNEYSFLRHYVINNGWGDVYSYEGFFFRIQLLGNALIPFLFFLSYYHYRSKNNENKSIIFVLFSFIGAVFCGNLTFFIAMFLFVFSYEVVTLKRKLYVIQKYKVYFFSTVFLLSPIFLNYIFSMVLLKTDGDTSSMGMRYDQFNVLISDLNLNYLTLLFGNGLGHTLSVVSLRDYTGDIYYELQSVYFLNQLGFINALLFFGLHLFLFFYRVKNVKLRLVYLFYLLYSSTNPYFLDTTQIVALIIIISLSDKEKIQIK
ncbi:O-antigen polymerase [Vibrio natriegens]|uniref:O-antigen polymerase n=1 Tax=Vibrio natriegens TaxID=691 RepID=UPI001428C014|nr:O-antigen polymerase [Vibrio natriegens]